MESAGYLASILIGISLGLIGGGGSILTVPVLVYLFKIDTVLATAYSLFVVGTTSVVGSISYFRKGLVSMCTAVLFGIPSVGAIFLTREYLLAAIPQNIMEVGNFALTKNILLMVLFAMLMIAASYSMIAKGKQLEEEQPKDSTLDSLKIFFQGILVGVITGLIGAGGGFLIIPVLVNLVKLPMKTVVGTSLVIIAINSLTGFLFSLPHTSIHWGFLFSVASIAIMGILIGSYLSSKIKATKLKPAFGWFVLVMGLYILVKEVIGLV